jgi:putative phosphoribosyl transferase
MFWRDYQPSFENRIDAGRRLAQKLKAYADLQPVVLALPRGGVPVGFEIAAVLRCPLDLVLVRKLGAPINPEFAVGAVVDGHTPSSFINEDVVRVLKVPPGYIERESREQLAEIERRRDAYLGGRPRAKIPDRTCIVVDDGIATGATVRVALQALRKARPRKLVLAVPVASSDSLKTMREDYDEAVTLEAPDDLGSVGQYYRDFTQVDDAEVIELLDRAAQWSESAPDPGER